MIEGVAPADVRRFHLDDEARCAPVLLLSCAFVLLFPALLSLCGLWISAADEVCGKDKFTMKFALL